MNTKKTSGTFCGAWALFSAVGLFYLGQSAGVRAETIDLAISFGEPTTFSAITPSNHDVARRDHVGHWDLPATALAAALPASANIDALSFLAANDIYFSLDSNVRLGGVTYGDEDIIHWDGSNFTLIWAGIPNGIPASANLDALDLLSLHPLIFSCSLDVPALLNVGGTPTLVNNGDVVRFDESIGFTGFDFVAADAGIPPSANLDAFSRLSATRFAVSFDVPVSVGGVTYDDSDLLVWNDTTGVFEGTPFFSASFNGVVASADLNAAEVNPGHLNYDGRPVGDFNNSRCTDLIDFLFLLDNWTLDFNGTPVGLLDFLNLLDNWQLGLNCP